MKIANLTQKKKLEHNRRSMRLNGYDYSQTGAYFITICVHNKRSLLGVIEEDNSVAISSIGEYVYQCLIQIPNRYDSAELDKFIIMPNHIHAIIIINNDVGTIHELSQLPLQKQRRKMLIPQIIGRFKMNSAKGANLILQKPGQPFWQRNYYDHIARNENELNRIREYIIYNPMKWQYDRENLDHIPCNNDDNLNQIKEIIYGKKTHSNQAKKPQME